MRARAGSPSPVWPTPLLPLRPCWGHLAHPATFTVLRTDVPRGPSTAQSHTSTSVFYHIRSLTGRRRHSHSHSEREHGPTPGPPVLAIHAAGQSSLVCPASLSPALRPPHPDQPPVCNRLGPHPFNLSALCCPAGFLTLKSDFLTPWGETPAPNQAESGRLTGVCGSAEMGL